MCTCLSKACRRRLEATERRLDGIQGEYYARKAKELISKENEELLIVNFLGKVIVTLHLWEVFPCTYKRHIAHRLLQQIVTKTSLLWIHRRSQSLLPGTSPSFFVW